MYNIINASVILERNETRLERNETRLEQNETRLERNETRLARNETRSGNLHLSGTVLGQWSASEKHMTSISSQLEPAIWSCDAGQQTPGFDRCQLTITWMSNIKKGGYKSRLLVSVHIYNTVIHTYTHTHTL